MARLTEEQKAANKVALKERTQAFSARRKVYQAELAAAEKKANQSAEATALAEALAASELALSARNEALQAIDKEIAKLTAQREQAVLHHRELLDASKGKRDAAWEASKAVETALKAEVDARFPDMDGCWYVSQWKRPEGV